MNLKTMESEFLLKSPRAQARRSYLPRVHGPGRRISQCRLGADEFRGAASPPSTSLLPFTKIEYLSILIVLSTLFSGVELDLHVF